MNSSRRVAIQLAPALVVAACAPTTGTTPTTSVQQVMLDIQFVLPLLDVLAAGVAVAVPGAAPIVVAAQPLLANAGAVFQTLTATMTETQAKPVVQQIEDYVAAALKVVDGAVQANPKLAGLAPKVSQAEAVLGLLTAFVSGVSVMPTAAMAPLPALLHR